MTRSRREKGALRTQALFRFLLLANRARGMLDLLEEIQNGILLGVIPVTRLQQLAKLAKEKSNGFGDPGLKDILGDIELRARVELAKLERTG